MRGDVRDVREAPGSTAAVRRARGAAGVAVIRPRLSSLPLGREELRVGVTAGPRLPSVAVAVCGAGTALPARAAPRLRGGL